jgi:hypothetical protein
MQRDSQHRAKYAAIGTLLGTVLAASNAAGQAVNVPIGGRTATMGGAGIAAGNDSAMPYLNPAGAGGLPGDVLAVSATVYSYDTRRAPGIFHPNGFAPGLGPATIGTDHLSSSTTGELPSSVMYFKELPPLAPNIFQRVGLALVIPYSERIELVGNLAATFPQTANSQTQSLGASVSTTDYYVGPTYAVAFGDRLRLGATLDALYVTENRAINYNSTDLASSGAFPVQAQTQYAESAWSLGMVPIVGAQARVVSDLWVGAAVAAPSVHLLGSYTSAQQNAGTLVDPTTFASTAFSQNLAVNNAAHSADRPMRISAGVAYDNRATWSAAADASMYLARAGAIQSTGAQSGTSVQTGDVARQYAQPFTASSDLVQSFALSVGGEIVVTPLIALRAGAFYNASNLPSDPAANRLYVFRLDRYGGTLGVGLRIGSFDTTLGGVYSRGTGSVVTNDISQSSVPSVFTSATSDTFMAVLSGAVTVEEARRTIEKTLHVPEPLQ